MIGTTKFVPVLAALAVGIIGAAGLTVHAEMANAATAAQNTATLVASTSTQQVSDGDGEHADDTGAALQDQKDEQDHAGVDVEINDNVQVTAGMTDKADAEGSSESESDTGDVQEGE